MRKSKYTTSLISEGDITGNKIQIEKNRRGVKEDSGIYSYGYALQRLSEVSKDGNLVRTYEYDAFGNRRKSAEIGKSESIYTYNAMNQLHGFLFMQCGYKGQKWNEFCTRME